LQGKKIKNELGQRPQNEIKHPALWVTWAILEAVGDLSVRLPSAIGFMRLLSMVIAPRNSMEKRTHVNPSP